MNAPALGFAVAPALMNGLRLVAAASTDPSPTVAPATVSVAGTAASGSRTWRSARRDERRRCAGTRDVCGCDSSNRSSASAVTNPSTRRSPIMALASRTEAAEAAIKDARGIVDEKTKKSDVSMREIKKKIQELKTLKTEAHEDKDKSKAKILRRRISRLKKRTRRAA